MSITIARPGLEPGDHAVHFYRDDPALVAFVGPQLAAALDAGAVTVGIATGPHLDALERELAVAGTDVEGALADGNLILLDASATLAKLIVEGAVSEEAFDRQIATVIRAAGSGGSQVCAYGEMVDLLWQRGDVEGALELERLWNGLIGELGFSLLCAYRSAGADAAGHEQAVREICNAHSSVSHGPDSSKTADAREVSREFDPVGATAHAARSFLQEALEHWGYAGTLLDDARLVISELVTNAVIHADTPLSVSVRAERAGVWLSVRDGSPTMPTPRAPSPRTASGRGLQLVAALSRDWGVEPTRDGKVVWAEL